MAIVVAQWTLDVNDVEAEAAFWSAALGYRIHRSRSGSLHLRPPDGGTGPTVWLQPVTEPRQAKNRLHLDFGAADPPAEVERLLSLGARPCDVGQTGSEGFTVLADPEGNEFCVFTEPRP
jgi:hypothetical protein